MEWLSIEVMAMSAIKTIIDLHHYCQYVQPIEFIVIRLNTMYCVDILVDSTFVHLILTVGHTCTVMLK